MCWFKFIKEVIIGNFNHFAPFLGFIFALIPATQQRIYQWLGIKKIACDGDITYQKDKFRFQLRFHNTGITAQEIDKLENSKGEGILWFEGNGNKNQGFDLCFDQIRKRAVVKPIGVGDSNNIPINLKQIKQKMSIDIKKPLILPAGQSITVTIGHFPDDQTLNGQIALKIIEDLKNSNNKLFLTNAFGKTKIKITRALKDYNNTNQGFVNEKNQYIRKGGL